MAIFFEAALFTLVVAVFGIVLYRIIVKEKDKDLVRREAEIKRKDLEIAQLKREVDELKAGLKL